MSSLRQSREERLRRNIDVSRRTDLEPADQGREWHYINLKEFEFNIRQEELEKYMALRKKESDARAWKRDAKNDLFKATLIPRFIGLLIMTMSIFAFMILSRLGDTDGTWLFITITLGTLLLIMPGCNNPKK